MLLNFLTSPKILAKEYFADGRKEPYPHVGLFTSHPHNIQDLSEFFILLNHYANKGGCLLKGDLTRQLNNESRQGSTDAAIPTHYVVHDVDRCDPTIKTPDEFILRCLTPEFHNVSYIWQWSNSAGITKDCLAGHIFFLLTTPIDTKILKGIYTLNNFLNPSLEASIRLSHNGLTLSYGLDVTTAQNDKLIFIAPPILHGITDPITERITLNIREKNTVTFDMDAYNFSTINTLKKAKIKALREAAGLERKTGKFKEDNGLEILQNPDGAIFRGPYKVARGFVYGNLNNGDSYGYYHQEENPKYLYNFKGEPIVRLQDIDPDYWRQLQPCKIEGVKFLAFRDIVSDTFYTVIYDLKTHEYKAHVVSNEKKACDFLRINREPIPETLPLWTRAFEPTKDYSIDFEAQRLNTFQKTTYLKNAVASPLCPAKFSSLILHIVGNDPDVQADLINWLAYIIQTREKTQTAYLLHGRTGTGKGVLFNTILRNILGPEHAISIMMDDFDSNFNGWLETALVVFVDESQINDDPKKAKKRNNKIKHLVTEANGMLERKNVNAIPFTNYASFIFASNEFDSVKINHQDRRFKVAPRQESPLPYTAKDIAEIEAALQDITNYLIGVDVDAKKVKEVLLNDARDALILASRTSVDEFVDIVKTGDLDALLQYRGEEPGLKNAEARDRFETYINDWQHFTHKSCHIPVPHLRSIYNYLFNADISAVGFGKILRSKGIDVKPVCLEGKTHRCVEIKWVSAMQDLAPTKEGIAQCGHTLN